MHRPAPLFIVILDHEWLGGPMAALDFFFRFFRHSDLSGAGSAAFTMTYRTNWRFAQQKDNGDKGNRRSACEAHSASFARALLLRTNNFRWRSHKKTSLRSLRKSSASASFQLFVGQ